MAQAEATILDRWQITAEELTEVIDGNPSLRGMLLGYLAEVKLRHIWFSGSEIERSFKYDDHDRMKKGDLVVVYRGKEFIIEAKSLQTNTIKYDDGTWYGRYNATPAIGGELPCRTIQQLKPRACLLESSTCSQLISLRSRMNGNSYL